MVVGVDETGEGEGAVEVESGRVCVGEVGVNWGEFAAIRIVG